MKLVVSYLLKRPWLSLIFIASFILMIFLPLFVHRLTAIVQSRMLGRARSTPLVVGAKGGKVQQILALLYFKADGVDTAPAGDLDKAVGPLGGKRVPMVLLHTAKGFPIVGTSLGYFAFRDLKLTAGHKFAWLGDCVVGAEIASLLQLVVGDSLLSDSGSLYDISKENPLKMLVVGILEKKGSPDDRAIFVDIRTTWMIAGLYHAHQDADTVESSQIVGLNEAGNPLLSKGVRSYNEVSEATFPTIHPHDDPGRYPLHGFLVRGGSAKEEVLLKSRINLTPTFMASRPADVVEGLLYLVFKIRQFFDLYFVVVLLVFLLFFAVIAMLQWRIRQEEFRLLRQVGATSYSLVVGFIAQYLLLAFCGGLFALFFVLLCEGLLIDFFKM